MTVMLMNRRSSEKKNRKHCEPERPFPGGRPRFMNDGDAHEQEEQRKKTENHQSRGGIVKVEERQERTLLGFGGRVSSEEELCAEQEGLREPRGRVDERHRREKEVFRNAHEQRKGSHGEKKRSERSGELLQRRMLCRISGLQARVRLHGCGGGEQASGDQVGRLVDKNREKDGSQN